MASADLLLHPVRLRVVQVLLGDRVLTTGELHEELPDVPAATLYRHVGLLADAGVLAIVSERKVRGAAERRYRLVPAAASADPRGMSAPRFRDGAGGDVVAAPVRGRREGEHLADQLAEALSEAGALVVGQVHDGAVVGQPVGAGPGPG